MSPLFQPPAWPDPAADDREPTWVHEILDGGEPLNDAELTRLTAMVGGLREFAADELDEDGIFGDGPLQYRKVRRPGFWKLVPATIAAADDPERAARFLKLMSADPLRTDVLCFLTVQSTADWIHQHFSAERIEGVRREVQRRFGVDSDDPRAAAMGFNVSRAERRLREANLPQQLKRLVSRHAADAGRMTGLIRTTTAEEVEAFKRAAGLGLLDYARLTSFDRPIQNPLR